MCQQRFYSPIGIKHRFELINVNLCARGIRKPLYAESEVGFAAL